MWIEFQHLSCQVVVIKGLAYLLTYFIAVVIDSKFKDWVNFGIYWKIYFRILGLGLDTSGLVNIPGWYMLPI